MFDSMLDVSNKHQDVLAFLHVKFKRFKDINLVYGHKVGDEFLSKVEQRLQGLLRPVDKMYRIGNSEYGLLLPSLHNASHAILAANKVVNEFQQSIICDGNAIDPKVVIGIVVSPDHGKNYNELIQHAAITLTEAEKNDEDYLLFTSAPESNLPPRLILERELQLAFEHEELSLYYQPKIDLRTHSVAGAEALIRWFSPKYGTVDTQNFVDILEDSNLLLPITKWILNSSLRQCAECQGDINNFSIAVNLSPTSLNDKDIVDVVRDSIKIWDMNPANLTLEVTEGAMMKNPDLSLQILKELSALGVSISIDDFGTGYSSLAYLKDLPASELKIDKSFVFNMLNHEKDRNIVKATIDLGHNLGMKVIAEGVENEDVLNQLIDMGCDSAQGFYMGRPMAYLDMRQWVKDSPWGISNDIDADIN